METTADEISNTNQTVETMATSDQTTTHIEPLTNKEFRQLMDHLPLYELLLVEIRQSENWICLYQIKSRLENKKKIVSVCCSVCKENFVWLSDEFAEHLLSDSHKQLLDKVQQFYHPIFRSNAKPLLDNLLSVTATKDLNGKYQSARILANLKKTEKKLIEVVLTTTGKKYEMKIFATVTLPLSSLMNTKFQCSKNDVLKPMIKQNANGSYNCEMCNEFIFNALNINVHTVSKTHKLAQIKSFNMSNSEYETLNKNYIYKMGEKYELSIDPQAYRTFKSHITQFTGREDLETLQNIENTIPSELYNKYKPLSMLVPTGKASQIAKQAIFNEGLIGVEYVVNLAFAGVHGTELFTCLLCKTGDQIETNMQAHLIGSKHRLNYLEQHYPDTMKKYKEKVKNNKHALCAVMQKLATAIEQEHGRSICYYFPSDDFTERKQEMMELLHNYTHASQMHGPLFDNLFSDEELRELCKNTTYRDLFVPIFITSRFLKIPLTNYLNTEHTNIKYWDKERTADCYRTVNHFPNAKPKQTTGTHLPCTVSSVKNCSEIWQRYHDKCYDIGKRLDAEYAKYRKNPESHPKYTGTFYNYKQNRKLNSEQRGVGFKNPDMQTEWMNFFKQRMEELYIKEKNKAFLKVRIYLNIPDKVEMNSDWLENSNSKQFDTDGGDRKRSPETNRDEHKRQRLNETNDFYQANRGCNDDAEYSSTPNPVEKPNIINVLRMLSALEDQLGSLGPTVVDLLSQSLTLQRKLSSHNPLELEKQILNTSNCDLLETTMEKLKGIMLTGFLDQSKQQGIQKIIMQTSELLEHANEMGWRNNDWSEKPQQQQSRTSNWTEHDINSAVEDLDYSRQKLYQHRVRDQDNFNDMYQNSRNDQYSQMPQQNQYMNSNNTSYTSYNSPSHSNASKLNRSSNYDNNISDCNEMIMGVNSNFNRGSYSQQNYSSNNSNNSEGSWSGDGGLDHRSRNTNNYNRGSNSQHNYCSGSNFNSGSMNQQNYSSHNSNNSEGSWSGGGGFDHGSRNMNNYNSRTNREMNPDSSRMSSHNNSFNNNNRYERNSERDQNWGSFQQNRNSRYQ